MNFNPSRSLFSRARKLAPHAVAVSLTTLFVVAVLTSGARAQTFTVLHAFATGGDGGSPASGLAITPGGVLYGTTIFGGTYGYGTVFKLKRAGSSWVEAPIYSFTGGDDGSQPYTTPLIARDGSIYGANYGQFAECCGAVFHLQPSPNAPRAVLVPWNATVLHHFTTGGDGEYPDGDIAMDASGSIYGTTQSGGIANLGTVYQLTPSNGGWTETLLYQTPGGSAGSYPRGNVVLDPAGNVYGVFTQGGLDGCGNVFEVSPSGSGWTENTIYTFTCGSDGAGPEGGLLRDQAGNLYGATSGGTGGSTIFELSPSGGGWTFSLLYSFGFRLNPTGTFVMDASGNLYGTDCSGGFDADGSVYKLTKPSDGHNSWSYSSLHDFTFGADGACPEGGVVFDANGNLYGTAYAGGASGFGVAFEITP